MAKILSEERVLEYSREFKVMVSRWRKEVRDGQLMSDETRRVRMTLESASKLGKKAKQAKTKTQQLEEENRRLKKEVCALKKWHGYLEELKEKDSSS